MRRTIHMDKIPKMLLRDLLRSPHLQPLVPGAIFKSWWN